ncbi:hypothetical protein, partial [Marinobacter salexigens]|uniref:hypothetical protein n=1 Tax=Marinobacter salexigens TaxID=1925763 RepID=UPI00195FE8F4
KYSSQRPHELLGQFVKERLSRCSIKVAYSTSSRRLVNRLFRRRETTLNRDKPSLPNQDESFYSILSSCQPSN